METYDELVCEVPDTDEFTTEGLCSIISATPWWADEKLPLAASGFEAYRYRKDTN
jgi:DNA polymerase